MTAFDDRVKAYREARTGFPNRLAFLTYLATGDDRRADVQAARRLIAKPRYAGQDLH